MYSKSKVTLGSERVKKLFPLFYYFPYFTLSNARQFYSSKGDPLGVKGVNLAVDFSLDVCFNFKLKVYELNPTICILNFNQPQTNIVSNCYNYFVKAFRRVPGSNSVLFWFTTGTLW